LLPYINHREDGEKNNKRLISCMGERLKKEKEAEKGGKRNKRRKGYS
jgi:hypothetical protein